GTVCVVGKIRDLILQLSKSSIYSTKPRDYLQRFEKALSVHKDSAGVISTLKKQYPNLAEESSLELSAKVNTGEMKW
ncbi:hypothetical protein POV86_18750, partial [Enterobacter roggenkampii]